MRAQDKLPCCPIERFEMSFISLLRSVCVCVRAALRHGPKTSRLPISYLLQQQHQKENWKLEMSDRFFFHDYLTPNRMNDWMNGWKKTLSQLIIRLFVDRLWHSKISIFFNKSHLWNLDEHESVVSSVHWTHTHVHTWCVHTHTNEASFSDSFIF